MSDERIPMPRNLAEEIGKRNPFQLPEEEAYLNLIRTADRLTRRVHETLAAHGLSEATYNVLRIVAARGSEGVPSQTIAGDMVTRDPDVTRLIDRLQRMGLVERHRSEEDRRVIRIVLTREGKKLLSSLDHPLRELLQDMLGHLGDRKLAQLSKLLFEARHSPVAAGVNEGGF